jgi:glycosyltransferase involved in cell wall biosynthesis
LKLISVILPLYNSEKYIEKSLKSILSQTYSNIEVIIIDDCSQDSSIEIVNKIKDNRVYIIKNPDNVGPASSLNAGIVASRGEFIAIMHSDDVASLNRLEVQYNFFQQNPQFHVLASSYTEIDEFDNNILKKITNSSSFFEDRMLLHNVICHPTVMFSRAILTEDSLYEPGMRVNEDYYFWLKLVLEGRQFFILPQSLLFYRIHKKQQSYLQKTNELNSFKEIRRRFWNQRNKDTRILDLIEQFDNKKFEVLLKLGVYFNKTEMGFISGLIHQEVKRGELTYNLCRYLKIIVLTNFRICNFKTIFCLIKNYGIFFNFSRYNISKK